MSEIDPGRPLARHGQLRTPRALGQLLKMVGIGMAVVLVSTVSVASVYLYDMTSSFIDSGVVIDGQDELPPDIAAFEGGFNILITGLDVCEEKYAHLFGRRCQGRYSHAGALNDVTILIHVSDEPRRITAISFPRDLLVPIPSCTDPETGRTSSAMSSQPLNSSYHYGGLNCVVKTVSALSGMDIQFAASVTFGGVIEITNAIGGVEVCLESAIRDKHTGIDWKKGTHTIAGKDALRFLRTRYGVGDGSDLGRISNQQVYMSSLARKVMSDGVLKDTPTLLSLARTVLNNVTPSQSLTNPVLLGQIALALKDVKLDDIVFLQYPSVGGTGIPGKVAPNYGAAKQMWAAIKANKPLEVTYSGSRYDGAVNKGEIEIDPPEGEVAEVTPGEKATKLPSAIRGTSAATQTCSNGNVRK